MAIKLNVDLEGEIKEFNIPQTWNEISIRDYQKIMSIEKENLNNIEIFVKMISILSNMDEELIYMLDIETFNNLCDQLDFTKNEINSELKDSITIGDEEYYLKKDFNKLTMGESISIELIISKSNGKLETVIDELLCIFLRKKNEKGELEGFRNSFMERKELFQYLKITDVYALFVFFSNGRS